MKQGSALVSLAFFMLIGAVVITAAVLIISSGAKSTTNVEQSLMAYHAAEAGVEEGMLAILRNSNNPNPYSETGTAVGTATYDLSVATDGIITSTGKYNGFSRKIIVTTTYNSGVLTENSWQEMF